MNVVVDEEWEDALATPKMRGLKQMFVSLDQYISNRFLDGKPVEQAHELGKGWQVKHNNHKCHFKEHLTDWLGILIAIRYMLNGGKWGPQLQYGAGNGVTNLKDPDDNNTAHPLIKQWLMPTGSQPLPKIAAATLYPKRKLDDDTWEEIFADEYKDQWIYLLQMQIDAPNWNTDHIAQSRDWDFRQIKSFRFHNSNSSFSVNFESANKAVKQKCIVKTIQNLVLEFKHAFAIKFRDSEPMYLCKGIAYTIHKSEHDNNWKNDYYSSMDYINKNDSQTLWCYMTNIEEPVFLIHNCVSFDQVKPYLPDFTQDVNKYDYIQNLVYWSTKLHQWQLRHDEPENTRIPCGPAWQCKRHNTLDCNNCPKNSPEQEQQHWKLKWNCNTYNSNHFWILDAKNGLVMTLMKHVHQHMK